jgi:hypothetical protein
MDWLQASRWATKYPTHKGGTAHGLGKESQDAARWLRLNTRPCPALFAVKKMLLDKSGSQNGDEAVAVGVSLEGKTVTAMEVGGIGPRKQIDERLALLGGGWGNGAGHVEHR